MLTTVVDTLEENERADMDNGIQIICGVYYQYEKETELDKEAIRGVTKERKWMTTWEKL